MTTTLKAPEAAVHDFHDEVVSESLTMAKRAVTNNQESNLSLTKIVIGILASITSTVIVSGAVIIRSHDTQLERIKVILIEHTKQIEQTEARYEGLSLQMEEIKELADRNLEAIKNIKP